MHALRDALKGGPLSVAGIKKALAEAGVRLTRNALITFLSAYNNRRFLTLYNGRWRLKTDDEQRIWLLRTNGKLSTGELLELFRNNFVELMPDEVDPFQARQAHMLHVKAGVWRALGNDAGRINLLRQNGPVPVARLQQLLKDARLGLSKRELAEFQSRHAHLLHVKGGQWRVLSDDERRINLLRQTGPVPVAQLQQLLKDAQLGLSKRKLAEFRSRHAHLLHVDGGRWRVLSDNENQEE